MNVYTLNIRYLHEWEISDSDDRDHILVLSLNKRKKEKGATGEKLIIKHEKGIKLITITRFIKMSNKNQQ